MSKEMREQINKVKNFGQFLKEDVNNSDNKTLIIIYQRVSEFGDRQELFKAFLQRLSEYKINYKQDSDEINFYLDEPFWGIVGNFRLLKDKDTTYGNYTISIKYISNNTHKDIIDYLHSTFEKIVYPQDADYEDYEQSYSADREYWIREIR